MVRVLLAATFLSACAPSTPALVERICQRELECFPGDYASHDECVDNYRDITHPDRLTQSPSCVTANRDLARCLAQIPDCRTMAAYWSEGGADYPCAREEGRVEAVCRSTGSGVLASSAP